MTPARITAALWLLAACGAGSTSAPTTGATPRPQCQQEQHWDGAVCRARDDSRQLIERGATALAEFRVDEALAALEQARSRGPYAYEDHVRLYEQLGVAYAYLERESDALATFEKLLALAPGHLLSYTLSPKATFLFARARENVRQRARIAVDLSWPRDQSTKKRLPIDVEVISDPSGFLSRATLHVRTRGDGDYRSVDLALPAVGAYERVLLPPPGLERNAAVELYLTAFDAAGNEVLRWATAEHPREISLRYDRPTPWYRKWWVWAVAGSAVAAGTAATVYGVTREPPDTVGGQFGLP